MTGEVLDLFLGLAAVPSPPGQEREVAERAAAELRALGLEVEEDDAGRRIGSTAGNLLCRLPASVEGGVPIFFCAHLDTVPPEGAIEPLVEGGVVRNAAGTILGADNKAAVAAMLVAVRRLVKEDRPHAGIELVLTVQEEVGLRGVSELDHTRLAARVGFVYDQAAPIGEIVVGAPAATALDVTFRGRASHAGMHPEEGRSAILAAARAVADLRLGRIDDETTANVGTIEGGVSRNIVPDTCRLHAEARSHDERKLADLVREMTETFAFAAAVSDCEVETDVRPQYRAYRFRADDLAVRLARTALERAGYEPRLVLTGGGADANVFNERGLPCANLSNGMAAIHSPDEHIAVADLEAMVEVTLALVDAAREAAA